MAKHWIIYPKDNFGIGKIPWEVSKVNNCNIPSNKLSHIGSELCNAMNIGVRMEFWTNITNRTLYYNAFFKRWRHLKPLKQTIWQISALFQCDTFKFHSVNLCQRTEGVRKMERTYKNKSSSKTNDSATRNTGKNHLDETSKVTSNDPKNEGFKMSIIFR